MSAVRLLLESCAASDARDHSLQLDLWPIVSISLEYILLAKEEKAYDINYFATREAKYVYTLDDRMIIVTCVAKEQCQSSDRGETKRDKRVSRDGYR